MSNCGWWFSLTTSVVVRPHPVLAMRCVDATLLVVCLAAAARRCDAAYTPVTAPAGTKNYTAASLGILSSSVVNSNVAALEQSAFAAPVTLRCTFINLAWNNDYFDVRLFFPSRSIAGVNVVFWHCLTSFHVTQAYGGLAQPVSAPLAVALSTLQPGSLLPLQPSDVDGFLVRIITSLASSLNFSVVCVRAPRAPCPLNFLRTIFLDGAWSHRLQSCCTHPRVRSC